MKTNIFICLATLMLLQAATTPAQAQGTAEAQHSFPLQHFFCNTGYTQVQCAHEVTVLRIALGKYPASELGEWTWVLVRSEDWRLVLLARTLNPNIPALTDPAIRTTFFEEVLVAGDSGRLSDLMAVSHLGREGLLDAAIRHELGHALCRDASEVNANSVAMLLEQQKPISCKTKLKPVLDRNVSSPQPQHH